MKGAGESPIVSRACIGKKPMLEALLAWLFPRERSIYAEQQFRKAHEQPRMPRWDAKAAHDFREGKCSDA